MTLAQLIATMEGVALEQRSIRSVVRNDVFRLNDMPSAQYGVFAYTQGRHRFDFDTGIAYYAFTLFYVDRLTEDAGNEIEVQSTGISTLANIVRAMWEAHDIPLDGSWSADTFNQRFADLCAGAFATVTFALPIDYTCVDGDELS